MDKNELGQSNEVTAPNAETLELYQALDGLPMVARASFMEQRSEEAVDAEPNELPLTARPSSVARRSSRPHTAFAAWWTSSILHASLLFCVILLAGSTSLRSLGKVPGASPEWRNLHPPREAAGAVLIPIALPLNALARTGEDDDAPATTVLLELSFDREGKARLVRAETSQVTENEPLSLSCARIQVDTSPGR